MSLDIWIQLLKVFAGILGSRTTGRLVFQEEVDSQIGVGNCGGV
jgi:hypothetical protein